MFERIKSSPRLKWTLGIILILILLPLLFYFSIYFGFFGKVPSSNELAQLDQSEATQVLSSDGELIGKYYVYDRQPITFDKLPQHLIDALIATEDVRFFQHDGIDGRSLLRVFFKTLLLQDKSSGGGSTITLQLAKNLYGRKDFGFMGIVINKVQESIIADRLEDIYSKDEILTLYLNTVPFSDNTYGIESAALKFFDKHTNELALEESAVLVGMLKASHYFNPRIFPERSRLRRDVVLVQMAKYNYISEELLQNTKQKDLELNYQFYNLDEGLAPYFREQIRKDIVKILDSLSNKDGEKYNIYRDGLIIHTTIDYKMQQLAEESVKEHMTVLQKKHEASYGKNAPWIKDQQLIIDALKRTNSYKKLKEKGLNDKEILASLDEEKKEMDLFNYGEENLVQASTVDSVTHYLKFLNAGFLAVDPATGAVKTWVGGVDFEHFKYDHVAQSKRQVGSTFKPIVYTAALENGIEPCTYYSVSEVTYDGGWTPSNSGPPEDDQFLNYTMETALSKSINTIAVKVLMQTGISNVVDMAKRMGIGSDIPKVPSIALGTAELSVKELAKAYTGYVNESRSTTPFYISRIEDGEGNLLAEFTPKVQRTPAYSETTRQVMLEMLQATVNQGTAYRLRSEYGLENDIAGKTGTTQNNKDGWFVGIMPKMVAVTWVGSDYHRIGFRNTGIGQGANSALPIFALFLQKLNSYPEYNEITKASFNAPSMEVVNLMNCEPQKRDGFFKRIFGSKKNDRREENDEKKKKGFFKRLFGGKKNKN